MARVLLPSQIGLGLTFIDKITNLDINNINIINLNIFEASLKHRYEYKYNP